MSTLLKKLSNVASALRTRVAKLAEDDGRWVTINGRHILLREGESVGEAMVRAGIPIGNKTPSSRWKTIEKREEGGIQDRGGGKAEVANLPRISGNFKPPKIDKMRAVLDKLGVSHAHVGKGRSLLDQRIMLQDIIKKKGLNPEDYT